MQAKQLGHVGERQDKERDAERRAGEKGRAGGGEGGVGGGSLDVCMLSQDDVGNAARAN